MCRSPCMDFLPPLGGVFRLSLTGSLPGIPCRQLCGCQGTVLNLTIKIATQQPEPDHPFRDDLGSGSLCSDKKVKNLLRLLREPSWNPKINMLYSIVGIDYHKNRAVSTKKLKIRHFWQLARKNNENFDKKREGWTVPALLTKNKVESCIETQCKGI